MNLSASEIRANARMNTDPIQTVRSSFALNVSDLTSLPAGKMVPITAFPLLREDRINSSTLRVSFDLMETVEMLMNDVNVSVKAYLVPNLAFERFSGMDELNRAYKGIANQEGGPVTPYIETMAAGAYGSIPIHKYLGVHAGTADTINTAYIEAYNQIWNFRAKNRSKGLALRTRLQTDLATAFWQHDSFRHIVPDFDQAAIDGQVALNVVNAKMPVKGLMYGTNVNSGDQYPVNTGALIPSNSNHKVVAVDQNGALPRVFAELAQNGITVSLSNIEMAKKTLAFAELRKTYGAHDAYIIDLLMDGISIPELDWRQPILLDQKDTVFGLAKRYATDGGNLTDSVVNGATYVDLHLATPTVPCGGVVMIVAEVTPDQLFERQRDFYLHTTAVSQLPEYLADYLDAEKVDVVKNGEVDTSHGTPNGTFGYGPLNWARAKSVPHVGGKFFRPSAVTTFDEDRQRIWAVETANPSLGADFYLCNAIHTKPFVVTNQDIGEVLNRGTVIINGLTVFGGQLVEANGDYNAVMAEVDHTRIAK